VCPETAADNEAQPVDESARAADEQARAADEQARSAGFAQRLLAWYETQGRKDLPWKRDPTPYRVWVSEIMLQQTQVATVVPYYASFLQRFPDVRTLASAPLDEVLHLWSGLGYYARARNLQRAAQAIVARHDGEFPGDLESVMSLPGIGRSTAGAILSFARGERHPVLDGNVKRVLARYFGVAGYPGEKAVERRLWQLAEACLPQERIADYAQAAMDLGATVCTRSRPACLLCPVNEACVARAGNLQDRLPGRRPRTVRPLREAWLVIALRGTHKVLIERRPPAGIWGGLWGVPEFPTRTHAEQWCRERLAASGAPTHLPSLRHAFSHFDIEMRPLLVHCLGKAETLRDDDRYRWYDAHDPARVGLPTPIARLLARVTATGGED
jgi:A/G-specific adenine glycosylase